MIGIALALAGCGATGGGDDRPRIVAGFYPLQFVADRVGGDRVAVTSLAQPGAEPHDLELSPQQVASIADADLVLYLQGFQPEVDEAVSQGARLAVDVATLVPLLDAPAPTGPADDDAEEAHEGGKDPHVWLDPTRLATIAAALAERLAQVDSDGAAGYRNRANDLGEELGALDRQFADGLAQCERRDIVTSHAAFGYLADRYGLRQIAITGLSPEAEPTPEHLAAAADEARRAGATTVFFETLVSPKVAEVVASTIGAETATLDPIEGLEPGNAGDYFSVMHANLATLRSALSCV